MKIYRIVLSQYEDWEALDFTTADLRDRVYAEFIEQYHLQRNSDDEKIGYWRTYDNNNFYYDVYKEDVNAPDDMSDEEIKEYVKKYNGDDIFERRW